MTDFQNQFREYIDRNELFTKTDRILVALSGGADSIALLQLLHMDGYAVSAAHCNFNLRGNESDGDEAFVRSFCEKRGVELYVASFNTKLEAENSKSSIEMVARDQRYAWFEELRATKGFSKIAVAHNSSDVVETFFINLSRGAGLKGLCSIQPVNGNVVRPLLFASREQIESFLEDSGIEYRTDSSNLENDYFRNKFRNLILPQIESFAPSFKKQVLKTVGYLNDTARVYEREIERVKQKLVFQKGETVCIDLKILKDLHPLQTYLFEILKEYNFNSDTVQQLSVSIFNERGKTFISPTHLLITAADCLEIVQRRNTQQKHYWLEAGDSACADVVVSVSERMPADTFIIPKDKTTVFFDADKLTFPLQMRKWQDGDRMKPFGMRGRSKKLSDIFTDLKFSKLDKESAWLICSGDEIIWLAGQRSSEFAKIGPNTREIVQLSVTMPH